jgi:hypothetical protein
VAVRSFAANYGRRRIVPAFVLPRKNPAALFVF